MLPASSGSRFAAGRRWTTRAAIWVLLYTGAGVILGLAGVEFGDTKRLVQLLEWFFLAVFAAAIVFAFVRTMRAGSGGDDGKAPPSGPRRPANVTVPVDEP